MAFLVVGRFRSTITALGNKNDDCDQSAVTGGRFDSVSCLADTEVARAVMGMVSNGEWRVVGARRKEKVRENRLSRALSRAPVLAAR